MGNAVDVQTTDTLAIYDDPNAPKKITIEMDFRVPKFTIEGPWTGRDIMVIRTSLARAYRARQRALYKATTQTTEPTTTEVKQ